MTNPLTDALPRRLPRFGHFLSASTCSLIGSNIFDIALPLYVLQRSQSVMDLSLTMVALHLPHFLMAPFTGYLVDRARKRQSLVLADLGQLVLLVGLSVYSLSQATALWPILVIIFGLKSLMLTFETMAAFQLIPALVAPDELNRANTWYLSLHRVVQILGPLMGGLLLQFGGIQAVIWTNALSFAATLHFYYRFRDLDTVVGNHSREQGPVPSQPTLSTLTQNFAKAMAFIFHSPLFRRFVVLMFLWNISALTLNSPTLTYFFTVTHAYSPAQYGAILSSFGVIGVLGFLLAPHLYRRRTFGRVLEGSALFQAVFGSLCLLAMGMPVLFGAFFGLSRAGTSVFSMGTYFIRQTRVPAHQSGSINASLRMLYMAAVPLSSLFQGWLITHVGVGTSLLVGIVCLWGTWHHARKLRTIYEFSTQEMEPPISYEKAKAI